MAINLWKLPDTNDITDLTTITNGLDHYLVFEKYDTINSTPVWTGIKFIGVMGHVFINDNFIIESREEEYNSLIQHENSDWVSEFYNKDRDIASFWKLKHFSIFIQKFGKYSYCGTRYRILSFYKGKLDIGRLTFDTEFEKR